MSLVWVTVAWEGLKDCLGNLVGSREPWLLWRESFFFFFFLQFDLVCGWREYDFVGFGVFPD